MGKKQIPDRWLKYRAVGDVIEGTNMFAFKVPLKTTVCESHLFELDQRFTPKILLEMRPDLKTVIDLTNTVRYYNPQDEFTAKGVDHVKIKIEGGGKIPTGDQFRRFAEAVREHARNHSGTEGALIGVHCTHGLNRTGYFVCRWMVEYLGVDPDDAIQRFNQARGHAIERRPYLEAIRGSVGTSSSSKSARQRSPVRERRPPSSYSSRRSSVSRRQENWRAPRAEPRDRCRTDENDLWKHFNSGRDKYHWRRKS